MAWGRVIGHDAVAAAFARAVHRGRLAHAYLFAGPAGVGKRLFAGELAKALLCEGGPPEAERPDFRACGHCPACAQVEADSHPDLMTVRRGDGSLDLRIDAIRELCQSFGLRSARGRGRVALVDDADDLNDEAANCFLKTLEEPPAGAVLVLVGTRPDQQLPTIRSRCQVVRFAPLAEADLLTVLRQHDIAPDLLPQLLRLAEGSPGQALALASPEIWQFHAELLRALASPRFDTVALGQRWVVFVEAAGKLAADQRRRLTLSTRLLIDFLSEALRAAVAGPEAATGPDEQATALARRLGPDVLLAVLNRCLEVDGQVERYAPIGLVVDGLVDALSQRFVPGRSA